MNAGFLRGLIPFEQIPDDADRLLLVFERPWPPWVWVLIVLGAAAFAIWSYARFEGSRVLRSLLAMLRGATLVLAAMLIAGPMVEMPREIVERDWVLILMDRSASMTVADWTDEPASGTTRDDQMRWMLRTHAPLLQSLSEDREVRWLGFHERAFLLGGQDAERGDLPIDPGPPSGTSTHLDTALSQAMLRAAGRPVSAIILLSDGRTSQPPSRALIRQLQADGIPVMTVPIGSSDPIGDLALGPVQAPSHAFVRDRVPVIVEVDRMGLGARNVGGRIQLIDELTGRVLAEEPLPAEESMSTVTLIAEPQLAGTASWQVVLIPDGADLVPENNERSFEVQLVDRPLRVLYIDGYPRWEYRFLKDILVREESIESSIMLLSADRDFAQEGNLPIARLPRAQEEWSQFDVIIIGDVPAGFFSPDQLEQMRTQVGDAGAGLLILAGERAAPQTFEGTPLADLLPFRGTLRLAPIGRPITIEPTPAAERMGVLRLLDAADGTPGWPEELADPATGWSRLLWAQRIDSARLKATAEVMAQTRQQFENDAPLPIVMQLRYGAGRSIYVATDEIWRWRYGRGDYYVEQFWIQLIRTLGRESLTRSGEQAVLTVNPRRAEVRQPVLIDLLVLDARLGESLGASVTAMIEDDQGGRAGELELRQDPDSPERFTGTWMPDRAGSWRVRVEGLSDRDGARSVGIDVVSGDEELRRPEADHELLARLAAETGGEMLNPADLSSMELRDRSIRTPAPIRERIWDTWLAFAIFLGLITAEWVGRRFLRLP